MTSFIYTPQSAGAVRVVRLIAKKHSGEAEGTRMKSRLILVEDHCKGKQAIPAIVLAFATNFAENDHVDYRDATTVQAIVQTLASSANEIMS